MDLKFEEGCTPVQSVQSNARPINFTGVVRALQNESNEDNLRWTALHYCQTKQRVLFLGWDADDSQKMPIFLWKEQKKEQEDIFFFRKEQKKDLVQCMD